MTAVRDVAAALRKEAKKNTGKEPRFRIYEGWKFGLSYGPVPLPPKEVVDRFKGPIAERLGAPQLAEATYEQIAAINADTDATHALDHQWIFSACLHPRGRGSVEADWNLLGRMMAAVGASPESQRTPFETTHPNEVHYWISDRFRLSELVFSDAGR